MLKMEDNFLLKIHDNNQTNAVTTSPTGPFLDEFSSSSRTPSRLSIEQNESFTEKNASPALPSLEQCPAFPAPVDIVEDMANQSRKFEDNPCFVVTSQSEHISLLVAKSSTIFLNTSVPSICTAIDSLKEPLSGPKQCIAHTSFGCMKPDDRFSKRNDQSQCRVLKPPNVLKSLITSDTNPQRSSSTTEVGSENKPPRSYCESSSTVYKSSDKDFASNLQTPISSAGVTSYQNLYVDCQIVGCRIHNRGKKTSLQPEGTVKLRRSLGGTITGEPSLRISIPLSFITCDTDLWTAPGKTGEQSRATGGIIAGNTEPFDGNSPEAGEKKKPKMPPGSDQSKPRASSSSVGDLEKTEQSDGSEAPIIEESPDGTDSEKPKPQVKYGELVILGYNGSLPQGDRGRKRSKFVLYKKPEATGVKRSRHYVVKTPQSSQAILDDTQHSISYTLSRNHAVIVEYTNDEETDMFQIGRSSETPIDFVVMDTISGDKNPDMKVDQSTISRFACRILCERNNPKVARVYAAGFDSSKNIFLGEKACKWQENGSEMDGQTTNGVLLMHPRGVFNGGEALCGRWVETSVGGVIFMRRESRSSQQRGNIIENETNELQDGTLIDLCGATLLWRSAEGLEKTPSKQHLEKVIDEMNAGRPQCPVGLNTLVIPRRVSLNDNLSTQQPYVYLNCGHVQGLHDWGQDRDSGDRKCPICLELGPVVKVCMGLEPAFYVDSGLPGFAFNPCGHMASEKTVKYWAKVVIPHGTNGSQSVCPFCATPLSGYPGYVRLIFQDNVD